VNLDDVKIQLVNVNEGFDFANLHDNDEFTLIKGESYKGSSSFQDQGTLTLQRGASTEYVFSLTEDRTGGVYELKAKLDGGECSSNCNFPSLGDDGGSEGGSAGGNGGSEGGSAGGESHEPGAGGDSGSNGGNAGGNGGSEGGNAGGESHEPGAGDSGATEEGTGGSDEIADTGKGENHPKPYVPRTTKGKAFSEGFLGGFALALQGGDFAAGSGLSNAESAAGMNAGAQGFGAVGGGKSKLKTGSHVNVKSLQAVAGVATANSLHGGKLTVGAFVEAGRGTYDSFNSFATGGDNGGKSHYFGAGLLGKMRYASGVYSEASFRAGSLKNEFDAKDLRDARGAKANYESNGVYFSAHLGGGYVMALSSALSLDAYAKFFYTHQEGDEVKANTGDALRFDSVNSYRARVGARADYRVAPGATLYGGAAFEREFDGKAKATVYGYEIEAPGLKGNTGILEAGVSFAPGASMPLEVDVGAQGFAGKRQGVSGGVKLKYTW
jgi:hypothetical protein